MSANIATVPASAVKNGGMLGLERCHRVLGLLLPCLLLAGTSCTRTNPCKSGTILISVRLEGAASMAEKLLVTAMVEGNAPVTTPLDHSVGQANGTLEITFRAEYPAGKRVSVTIDARHGEQSLGTGDGDVTLSDACETLDIDVAPKDGGGEAGRDAVSEGGGNEVGRDAVSGADAADAAPEASADAPMAADARGDVPQDTSAGGDAPANDAPPDAVADAPDAAGGDRPSDAPSVDTGPPCNAPMVACADGCIDPQSAGNHCGATAGCGVTGGSAGVACPSGQTCAMRLTFQGQSLPFADTAFWMTARDLNRDGKVDVVTVSSSGSIYVLLGNGDGTLQSPQSFMQGNYGSPEGVAAGDFNGDGQLDLAIANGDPDNLSIVLGNSDGTFQMSHETSVNETVLAAGDLNGDGRLDLAGSNASYQVHAYLGAGNGTFAAGPSSALNIYPAAIAVAELNGDGKLDVLTTDAAMGNLVVVLGLGTGAFQNPKTYAAGTAPRALTVRDLNGDGKLDVAVANYTNSGNSVSILLGVGDGTFQMVKGYAAGTRPIGITAGDVNGDGKPDLVVPNDSAATVSVLVGNGDGSFRAPQTLGVPATPSVVDIADMNGDGRLDIVVATGGTKFGVTVLLGGKDTPQCGN